MDSSIDMGRVAQLLGIVQSVSEVAPGFVYISGEAMAELREIDQTIRKTKQREQELPVTPAPVGDPESPAQPIPPGGSEADFDTQPEASKPIDHVDGPTPPPIDPPAEVLNPAPEPADEKSAEVPANTVFASQARAIPSTETEAANPTATVRRI